MHTPLAGSGRHEPGEPQKTSLIRGSQVSWNLVMRVCCNKQKQKKLLKKICLRQANYLKKFTCGGQNTQKKLPAAGKILKFFCLRQVKYSKDFACGGQNNQINLPAVGKYSKNFACGRQNTQKFFQWLRYALHYHRCTCRANFFVFLHTRNQFLDS